MPMLVILGLACAPGASTADSGLTWWADVRPVIDRNCARCHEDGGQATSFDDFATAQSLAPTMKAYTEGGRMPLPAPDPTCADYANSDRFVLADDEQALLSAWVDAGAPEGDAADYLGPDVTTNLSSAPFDVEVRGGAPYQPDFGQDGNDYRCFEVDVGNAEAAWLTGLEALVDNLRIVHHVVLFKVSASATLGDDSGDPHDGFACGGLGEATWEFVGAWAPGANPILFPEGSGLKLAKDTRLVLQMHYFESFDGAAAEWDQSGYGLHLADQVDRRVYQFPYGVYDFTIPAGSADYAVKDDFSWDDDTLDILGVWPHMHVLGSGIDEVVEHEDGSETCLLHQDAWNFHNQVWPALVTPVTPVRGDTIRLTCHYDNSASNPAQLNDPPVDVSFGEETNDEMCFGFTYVVERE